MSKSKKNINSVITEYKIILFFFSFVVLAGWVLQKLVLPLTPWHAGQGLMSGGDWITFQTAALAHVEDIRAHGWSVFSFSPEGHGPSGLAALVYAITGLSDPWQLLPIHGAVYGLAALGLFWIVRAVCGSERMAMLALLPMLLMPSLAMVWGQLHKDVWAIAAVLLLMGFWARLFVRERMGLLAALLLLGFVNLILAWMRPYTLQIILAGQLVMLMVLLVSINKCRILWSLLYGILALAVTIGVWQFTKPRSSEPVPVCKEWNYSLPFAFVDGALLSLACTRDVLMTGQPDAKSNLDIDISFSSASDVAAYVPRAMQIGVFSPFPNMWLAEGTAQTSRLFRFVAAVETFVMYTSLLGLAVQLVLMFNNKYSLNLNQKICFSGLVLFSLLWVGIYALASVNVGSIYRVRFPVMLLWMGLGFVAWYKILEWLNTRRR